MDKQDIGWIGLGNMGIPMCRNLLKAGYRLSVYNRTRNKAQSFVDAGANAAQSIQALLNKCDIVFTMVSDDNAAKEIYTGKEGLLAANRIHNKLFINTSTISPETSKYLATQCAEKGIDYLEAPVSGSVKPAEDGTLVILTGGPKETFEKAKPVLDCLGKLVMYLGDYGQGSRAKLAINLLVATNVQGLAETVLFAQENGIDAKDMLTIINEGSCGNGLTKAKTHSILNNEFTPAFTVKNTAKDMRLIKEAGVTTPLAKVVIDTYQNALREYAEEDLMAVISFLNKK